MMYNTTIILCMLLIVIFCVINKRLHNITQYIYNIMVIWYIDIFGDLLDDNIITYIVRMRLHVLDILLSNIFSKHRFIVLFYFI